MSCRVVAVPKDPWLSILPSGRKLGYLHAKDALEEDETALSAS
jgi:hypothetical protein